MEAGKFISILEEMGGSFYTGVPDSLLKPFLDEIVDRYGVSDRHIVAANEGAAVGIAAGHYLASGRPAVVYMQNSGIGNAVNPICSLLHSKVYSIPVIFVIGWRGEPGVKDEPQHIFQGEVTLRQLELLEIPYIVLPQEKTELMGNIGAFRQYLKNGQSVAFVVKKDALHSTAKIERCSDAVLSREEALEAVLGLSGDFICVCSTGKLSREVFEIRDKQKAGHSRDFLTVGSMGHSISIALGIARVQQDKRIVCLDGDGAALMHLGSLAVTGVHGTENLVHIVFNNGAHETVGGMPTVCSRHNMSEIAGTFGYKRCLRLKSAQDIAAAADVIKNAHGPVFAEVVCNLKSRSDLGRPSSSPAENKEQLMRRLGSNRA